MGSLFGGSSAPKPSAAETAATTAQTGLLQQEKDRISNLQEVLKRASVEAEQQLGITGTGSDFDTLVGKIIGSGQSGEDFAKGYTEGLPPAPANPGKMLSFDEWRSSKGMVPPTQDIGKPGKTGYKNVSTQTTEQFNQYKQYREEYDSQARDYNQYKQRYGTPDPGADPGDPGAQMSFEDWLVQSGHGNLQPIGIPGKPGYVDVATQKTKLIDQYAVYQRQWNDMRLAHESWKRESDQYQSDKAAGTGVFADRTGQSRTGYEAGTVADMVKEIAGSSKTDQEFLSKLKDRLNSALQENPDETAAKKALMDRVLSLTTGQGAETYQSLLDRVTRGAKGEQPIDPATQRDLDRQEAIMGNTLRKQLGTGYATSTAGAMRLGDFAQARAAAVAKDQREGLQSAIDAITQYGKLPEDPIKQRIMLEGQGTARVQDALNQYSGYQSSSNLNLKQLIENLQAYEGGIYDRKSKVANQYLQYEAAPYSQTQAGTLADQYGKQAEGQQTYASQPGVDKGLAATSTAIGATTAIASLIAAFA